MKISLSAEERENLIEELTDQQADEVDTDFLVQFYKEAVRGGYEEYTDDELTDAYIEQNGSLPASGV